MKKRTATIVVNLIVLCVLVGLGVAIFTTDLSNVFISVSAPIYKGDQTTKNVSLMFVLEDDTQFLPETLDLLTQKGISATFFVGGSWASANRDLVLKIAANPNFELANHAYFNQNLSKQSESNQKKEIQDCASLVKTITSSTPLNTKDGNQIVQGIDMKLFMPPNGNFNKDTLKAADSLGYRTVMWSIDATSGSIYDRAVNNLQGGDFVLVTPSLAVYAALPGILTEYARQGFTPVTVSANINS